MIARGAEANPSCFHASKSLQDPIETIVPRYARIALAVNNPFGNTKYCLNAMDFSSGGPGGKSGSKDRRKQMKVDLSRVKTYEQLCELLGVEQEPKSLEELLPGLRERLQNEDGEIEAEVREEVEELELKHKKPSSTLTAEVMADKPATNGANGHSEHSEPAETPGTGVP